MKKTVLTILVCGALVLGLTGCGSKKEYTLTLPKEESIQDYPVNAENIIKIEFDFKEGGQSLLYVYKKSEKMYIEVPYNGIYRINGDEYNSMEKYTRIN